MVPALVLMALSLTAPLSRAGNLDIISRLDRRFIPYSGLSSSPYPMRRYRYPIYTNKRSDYADEPEMVAGDDDDYGDHDKRFLRGMSLRPLQFTAEREKKLSGLTPRYDLSMTPYDLKVMAKLHQNGRRKRTPEVYDLKHIYRILEAGKKRSSAPEPYDIRGDAEDDSPAKRGGVSLYDLWDASRINEAGKKRGPASNYYDLSKSGVQSPLPNYDLWELAKMQEVGKRSMGSQDLLDLARMHEAGKRFSDHSIFDLARMHQAGKRSMDGPNLWDLARMHEAGKRSVDNMALLDLARMEAAGKRSSPEEYHYMTLAHALNEAGKRAGLLVNPYFPQGLYSLYGKQAEDEESEEENNEGGATTQKRAEKKKRSFDDYFGWDRKKKSVGAKDLADEYIKTLKKEVIDKADKTSDRDAIKKSQEGDED